MNSMVLYSGQNKY